jgi:hypothetical protein
VCKREEEVVDALEDETKSKIQRDKGLVKSYIKLVVVVVSVEECLLMMIISV